MLSAVEPMQAPLAWPLAGDLGSADAQVAVQSENRSSGLSDAPGDALRLESWLAHAYKRSGSHSVLRREAQRLGPIREPAALDAALTALADLDRVRLVSEGKRRLIRLTLATSVDVCGPAGPTEANGPVAARATVATVALAACVATADGPTTVATVEPKATVAASPCVVSVATSASAGSVATVADLSAADREWYEERSAILEYDSGLSRCDAEAEAWRLLGASGRKAQAAK